MAHEEDGASDDELSGVTLDHMIKSHGSAPCGEEDCKIDAAILFVEKARQSEDPWGEVLALHVHVSMLDEAKDAIQAIRRSLSLFLFDLVDRMGGFVFVPPYDSIMARPGTVSIEPGEGKGFVLRIEQEKKTPKDLH
jgi:hypothetical protein